MSAEQPIPASQMRASHEDREHVAEVLRQAAGDGRLDIDELEGRLEQTFSAKTYGELEPILRDLPLARTPIAPAVPEQAASVPLAGSHSRIGGIPSGSAAVAIFGGTERKGIWVVPERLNATAILGGIELDLREARFAAPIVQINCVAIMGGIEVTVPADVVVHVEGQGIMGGFGRPSNQPPTAPGAPIVRITGVAIFGGVDVKVKGPKRKDKSMPRLRMNKD